MKQLKWSFLLLAFSGLIVFTTTSCEDENPEPEATCTDGIQNGDETGVDCGGDCDPCPTCDDGIQNGDEEGVDCGGTECDACLEALQDTKWQSSGSNVAVLLVVLFNTDSIYAEFHADYTYLVEQYDADGGTLVFTGTYTQEKSGTGEIYNITINQSTPAVAIAEGIFEITGDEMKYEIVQTDPPAGTPPTAEAGFGSTNGGTLTPPDANVQTFVRIE